MIYVNLKGGLGNQMFQYACARALSLRTENPLAIVRTEHVGDTTRAFSLKNFSIQGDIVSVDAVPWLQKFRAYVAQKVFRQFSVHFRPSILTREGTVYLDGYFQSEKYFIDYAEQIRKDFTVTSPLSTSAARYAAIIAQDPFPVALHVRRGDYVNNPDFGGIADAAYYGRAIAALRSFVPEAHFYVFSDDIAWCKENINLPSDTVFVSQPDMRDYEELTLMARCHYMIMANSSFSWWGAWLNTYPAKIVIAPALWSHHHNDTWYRDIIPPSWIRI